MALLFVLLGGCASARMDPDAGSHAPEGLSLEVIGFHETARGIDVELLLRNESSVRFEYLGYAVSRPSVVHQYLTDVAWVQPLSTICGFDLRPVWLVPGERAAVYATVFSGNRLRKLRVGIASSEGQYVVWSPLIDVASHRWATLANDAARR